MLETIHPENEKLHNDVAYLLGWCYIQLKQWEDAFRVLSPLLEAAHYNDGEQGVLVDRERLALHLLYLGQVAIYLAHFEEASQHLTLCLKVLHDRRVHLPGVRIKVRYYLALTCCCRELTSACVEHYEEALHLARHYGRQEIVPDILYQLCEAYRRNKDYMKAYTTAQEALSLYRTGMDRQMEAHVHQQLGHACRLSGNYTGAINHFTDSLALAVDCQQSTLVMSNYTALAEVHLVQGQLGEAKRSCQHALQHLERSDDLHMHGVTYQLMGKVMYTEARQAEGTLRVGLLEDASLYFEKALTALRVTQAYADIAEVYTNWAVVLEDLGRLHEAIECWRWAYEVLSPKA
jgi:tetratricopeptide (TPR) repeat protein